MTTLPRSAPESVSRAAGGCTDEWRVWIDE
jgi:hypothetical protein